MKKFKFKLESVLKYKDFLEKEAKQALMTINMDIRECEANIEEIRVKRARLVNEVEKETEKGIAIELFQMFQNYIGAIENNLENERNRLKLLFDEKDLRTLKLIDAKKEKEAIAKLKSNKKKKFMEEMIYEEQKELDEISSIKKAREICNEM